MGRTRLSASRRAACQLANVHKYRLLTDQTENLSNIDVLVEARVAISACQRVPRTLLRNVHFSCHVKES